MKVEGSYDFAAPRDVVWPMLQDPEVLARVLPGCERLDHVGDNRYEGALNIKIGPVQGSFDGAITLSDIQEPESASVAVTGQGPAGFVSGTGRFWLDEAGATSTLRYAGDAQIGGRLAAVGQRLLDSSAKAIIQSGLEGLDAQVRARTGDGEEGTPVEAAAPEAPSQTEFAMGVVRNYAKDVMEDPARRRQARRGALTAGVLVLLYAIFRLLRGARGRAGE